MILGNGFIGNKIRNYLKNSVISKKRINSVNDVEEEIKKFKPNVVINCIGKTGTPNVDWCETHKLETIKANITVPLLILEACQNTNKYMVHISTGCLYEGDNNKKGFNEEDKPNFSGSFYSRSKLYIEKILKEYDILQLRIRMPLDDFPTDKNIIDKLLKYKKIINIPNSITYIPDFLDILNKLIEKRAKGIYNVVNKNPITHPEIMELYKEIVDTNIKYEIISLNELNKIIEAKRSNCVLNVNKLEKEGIDVRDIKEAVKEALTKYKEK